MGALSDPFVSHCEAISIVLLGNPTSRTACELRWGAKGSLCVSVAGARIGRFYNFETGTGGDLIDLICMVKGCAPPSALKWLHAFIGQTKAGKKLTAPVASSPPAVWSYKTESIWADTVPVAGTLGERYLRSRNCYVPNVADLRYSSGDEKYPPSLVARVTDFDSAAPMTLVFIALDPDSGDKISGGKAKHFLSGHRSKGGVVRLSPAGQVGGILGIAEGIETTLSVIASGDGPAWAALSANNLKQLTPPSHHRKLIVWADNDPAGLDAADYLVARWSAQGHRTQVKVPPDRGDDWNDVAMAAAKGGRA